jgi:RNA polymerase sigma factor (sigma-70 family)
MVVTGTQNASEGRRMAAPSSDNSLAGLRLFLAAQTPPEVPDRELLDRFLARQDESAFAALVHRHGAMVLGACRRVLHNAHDAEDACQATFLILAHKAAAIRKRDALGSWLHGVAVHVARDLRAKLARRAARPLAAGDDRTRPAGPEPLLWDEVRQALDEELRRLPEQYRAPLVLCYLEGRSRDEAAQQLGCSLPALRGRLERGRALLHARLVRRGLTLSAALVAGALAHDGAAAAVPARLVLQIVASATARGAAAVSPQVAALVHGGLSAMRLLKKKHVLALLLVAFVGAGGYSAYRFSTAEPPAQAWATALTAAEVQAEETVQLTGQVLDPDGHPREGAELFVMAEADSPLNDGPPRATSGADGRFTLAASKSELARHLAAARAVAVVAVARGFGMAWSPAANFLPEEERAKVGPLPFDLTLSGLSKNAAVLKLVKDTPLAGRIETPDGKPVAGATVRLEVVYANAANDLTAWRAAADRKEDFGAARKYLPLELAGPGLARFTATTDREGRFRLAGVGANRVADLRLAGPGLAAATLVARTQPGPRLDMNLISYFCGPDPHGCFGADFAVTAAPARPIVGVVRDADTGRPVPGAVVQSHQFAGSQIQGIDYLRTRADAEGRYRLDGMPAGKGNMLLARGPADQPYLPACGTVDTSTGEGSATLDLKIKRGLWAEGQVTDASTGRPLSAAIDYYCLWSNPHGAEAPGFVFAAALGAFYHTDAAGHFRVPVLPGRGLVAVLLHGQTSWALLSKVSNTWQAGKSYAKYQGKFDGPDAPAKHGGVFVETRPMHVFVSNYNQVAVIDPPEKADSVKCDLPVYADGSPLKPAQKKEAGR